MTPPLPGAYQGQDALSQNKTAKEIGSWGNTLPCSALQSPEDNLLRDHIERIECNRKQHAHHDF